MSDPARPRLRGAPTGADAGGAPARLLSFSSGAVTDEARRRWLLTRSAWAFIVITMPFVVLLVLDGRRALAAAYFSASVTFALVLILLRGRTPLVVCAALAVTALGGAQAYSLVDGGIGATGAYWVSIYPVAAFLLAGQRLGAAASGAFLAALGAIAWLASRGAIATPYSTGDYAMLGAACAVTAVLMSMYERSRARAETELAAARRRLELLATHDPLTGLFNRHQLVVSLERELRRAERYGTSVAVIYLDLDGFKPINDRFGHARGDEVLRLVARILRDSLRATDIVARAGGDEFVAVATDLHGPEDARRVVAKIAARLELPEGAAGVGEPLRASVGSALFPADAREPESLIAAADAAMYRMKGERRASRDAAAGPLR